MSSDTSNVKKPLGYKIWVGLMILLVVCYITYSLYKNNSQASFESKMLSKSQAICKSYSSKLTKVAKMFDTCYLIDCVHFGAELSYSYNNISIDTANVDSTSQYVVCP